MLEKYKNIILKSFAREKATWESIGMKEKAEETEREKDIWLRRVKREEKLSQRQLAEDLKNF